MSDFVARTAEKHGMDCYLEGLIPLTDREGKTTDDVLMVYHVKFKSLTLIQGYRLLAIHLNRHADIMEKI